MKNTFKTILIVCSAIFFLSLAASGQTGTTQYIYDDNGRLTAVITPSGEVSVYEYDSAGNIISVTRQNNSIVLISSLAYSQSDCQTNLNSQIIIRGTGFISDLNQNAVSFGGVAGTIISATQNEIVAVVPQGFVAGNVSVSNSNGVASKYFSINSVNSSVIIPNTPPQSVNLGSSGQILSLCFEGAQNKNISLLLQNSDIAELEVKITSPSGNNIVSNTYASVEGNIFVDSNLLTENGKYDVKLSSAVGQTGGFDLSLYEFDHLSTAISVDGAPANVSIVKPGQNAKIQFLSSGTIYKLDFDNLAIGNYSISIIRNSDGQSIQEITALPALISSLAGDYTILFNPSGISTGNVSLKLRTLNSIQTDGTPETVNLSGQEQFVGLTFSAIAGQTFNLRASNITVRPSYVGVVKPNGETLISDFIYPWNTGTSLRFTVPTNGVYTVTLSSFYPNATGSATFSLNLLNDVIGTLIINNPAANFISTLPGQSFRLSFAGNQGQRFYLKPNADDFYDLFLKIIKPDGTELLSQNISSTIAVDVNNLPATGTYTIIAQPNFVHQFGSLTLRAIDDDVFISNLQNEYINAYFYSDTVTDLSENPKSKEVPTINQAAKSKEVYSASANLSVPTTNYLYNGTANKQFSFAPYGSGGPQQTLGFAGGTMNLYLPDGTLFDSVPLEFGVCNISLPETGTYRIEVIPEGGTQMFTFVRVCGGGSSDGGPSLTTAKPSKRIKKFVKSN